MTWFEKAACRGAKLSFFFPEISQGDSSNAPWAAGLQYCHACPVTEECLAFVEPFERIAGRRDGLYGGLTPRQRDQRRKSAVPVRIQ